MLDVLSSIGCQMLAYSSEMVCYIIGIRDLLHGADVESHMIHRFEPLLYLLENYIGTND